jgi:hypothetical protein
VKCLRFERRSVSIEGRSVRRMTFEERSLLPLSAACVVASGVRETLGGLIGEAVLLKLYEPAIPSADAWKQIARDASIYRVHGACGDAAVILRAADAAALAGAAFGEPQTPATSLSVLERTVVERTVRAIAAQFGPICGTLEPQNVEEIHGISGLQTFFELQIERPVSARIGVALARDPQPETHARIDSEALLDLEIELAVRSDFGSFAALAVAELEPGSILRFPLGTLRGTLEIAGTPLAGGECGVNGGRYAIVLDQNPPRRDDRPA